ncbi:MAG: hypothetical protein HUU55_11815 [Myxococcales bacterium]|nr:hypothetical protein [Myxococcales bacterium]
MRNWYTTFGQRNANAHKVRNGSFSATLAFFILFFYPLILHSDESKPRYCGVLLFPEEHAPGKVPREIVDDFARVTANAIASLSGTRAVDPAEIRTMLPTGVVTTQGLPSVDVFRPLLDRHPFELLLVGQVSGTQGELSIHLVRVSDERLLDRAWKRTVISGAYDAVAQLRELATDVVIPGPTVLTIEIRGEKAANIEVDGKFVASGKHYRLAVTDGIRTVRVVFPNGVEFTQQTRCRKGRLCSVIFDETPVANSTESADDNSVSATRIAAWSMVALAIASTGAGIGFGLHTQALERELQDACPSGKCSYSRSRVEELENEGNISAVTSTVFFATAAATACTAVILFLVDSDSSTSVFRGTPLLLPNGTAGVSASFQF